MSDSCRVLSSRDFAGLQAADPPLILASGSQTRLFLLQEAGLVVTARPAEIDEDSIKRAAHGAGASPDETALLLADRKARHVSAPHVNAPHVSAWGALVIGADQLLVCEERWFDKPPDLSAARAQLLALRGRSHVLHTAVCLYRDGQMIWQHLARPRLSLRAFSEAALDAYLALEGDRVLSSVGAYRLEGPGIQLFDAIEGEHAAILGLPLLALLGFLRQYGVLLC